MLCDLPLLPRTLKCDFLSQVQTPVAIVDQNINRCPVKTRAATRAAAEAFVEYLFTPEAQAEFAAVGFRCAAGLGTLPYPLLSKHPSSRPSASGALQDWDPTLPPVEQASRQPA